MQISVSADIERITRDLRAVNKSIVPVVVAQTLNRTNSRIRTLSTRAIASALGIKPQKRVRRRIFLPRGGRAFPNRWTAVGFTLFAGIPARYLTDWRSYRLFQPKGKPVKGAAFEVRVRNGGRLVVKRGIPRKPWSQRRGGGRTDKDGNPQGTHLPIHEMYADVSNVALDERKTAIKTASKEYPALFAKRLKGRLKTKRAR